MTTHLIGTREEWLAARLGLLGHAAALGVADWLSLAAAPTFAIMALLTSVLGSGQPDMLCSAAHGASSLSGMVPMYLLMSAFHLAPWLKLVSSRRSRAFRSWARPYAPSCRKTVAGDPAAALADSFSPRQTS